MQIAWKRSKTFTGCYASTLILQLVNYYDFYSHGSQPGGQASPEGHRVNLGDREMIYGTRRK